MALLIEETTNQTESQQIKSNQMLVFGERGKPEYPGKILSEQSREPTNSTHIIMKVGQEIELGPHWWNVSQCAPYQAVTGKIYHLKQQLFPPATS